MDLAQLIKEEISKMIHHKQFLVTMQVKEEHIKMIEQHHYEEIGSLSEMYGFDADDFIQHYNAFSMIYPKENTEG